MAFSKAFPSRSDKSVYPKWVDVALTEVEEIDVDKEARQENLKLMRECIRDAHTVIASEGLKSYQANIVNIAIALFEKRASHTVFWKENKAKDKFETEQP